MLDTVSDTKFLCSLLSGTQSRGYMLMVLLEFGKEKSESLAGLSDKEVEDKVTGLVKTGI